MRRAPRRQETRECHPVHSTYPLLFWKTCSCCKQEFRRERGWYFYTSGMRFQGIRVSYESPRTLYLCSECAPDEATAVKQVAEVVNGGSR